MTVFERNDVKEETFNKMLYRMKIEASPGEIFRNILYRMPYGSQRRNEIYMRCPVDGFPVNARHTLQVKRDPDLKYLIKAGKMKIRKQYTWSCTNHRTFLVRV